MGVRDGLVEFDPVVHEAQIACISLKKATVPETGPHKVITVPIYSPDRASFVTDSCPYPSGFGPCADHVHVHKEIPRVRSCPQIECNELENKGESVIMREENTIDGVEEASSRRELTSTEGSFVDKEEVSDETLNENNIESFIHCEILGGRSDHELRLEVERGEGEQSGGLVGCEQNYLDAGSEDIECSDDVDPVTEAVEARRVWDKGGSLSIAVKKKRSYTDLLIRRL
ncbi:hypothetical protein PIB30_077637 [Stylosanthes scabra]|uniref:Uncharacterized protein n=1 Tax=Stylosanthes scabra TaxID=79078 RepID=A0ABU6VRU3_9FABA|nr:hypothetical protein [Stylosanthes scabra]